MKKRKVISLALATALAASMLATGCSSEKKNETSQEQKDDAATNVNYNLPENIKDGTILQCFEWSFNTIAESMEDIAKAGFTAIQTSPANECLVGGNGGMELMGQGKWYYTYQPTDWTIGNYQLGTKDEFKNMCSVAESYGVKVIVDVVPNHTTGNTEAVNQNLFDAAGGKDKLYHTTGLKGIESYADRKQCTLYQQGGLNDVNTENKAFQDYFIAYLNECIACGADGFRYDTAKHIGLPDDPKDEGVTENNFWDRVITEVTDASRIFNYGEVLQGDNDRCADYVKAIGATTASNYGQSVRWAFVFKTLMPEKLESYQVGDGVTDLVTWVESHDNYCGGESVNMTENDISLAWAFITARKDGTPLFFSRPYASNSDNMWGMNRIGKAGSYIYKNDIVSAANHFRNAMIGESEKLTSVGTENKAIAIERGTKGIVLISVNDQDMTLDQSVSLADGTYVDRVDGTTTYTVSGGKLTGTLKANSAVILYNDGYVDQGVTPVVDVAEGTGFVYNTESLNVTLKATNCEKATYSINGGTETEYTDGTSVEIKASADNSVSTLTLKGKNGSNDTAMTFEFTQKQGIAAGTKVYFKAPEGWSNEINAYVYDESGSSVKTNGDWPGVKMTKENDGTFSYTFTDVWENGLIIFSDGNNQYPASMEPGLEVEADKVYTKE